jgi:solute:Na+ symporter, SSS family
MHLSPFDWIIIAVYFAISLWIGLRGFSKSSESASEFFLSGRNMPWWLLGVSMVATTFSCDTPNLVTDIVRRNGVSGNWVWWAFLLTGMLTVFVYAKLWRRSGVLTDLEFYEMRYSGQAAKYLRMFRALYLGVFFNVMIMATVSLAAIKIGSVMLGLDKYQTLLIASVITVIYSMIGGFKAVLLTDFFQFIWAMVGSIGAAYWILHLPQIGGLNNLLSNPVVAAKMPMIPDFSDLNALIPLLIMPIAVQWWSVWYPGAEPGGGGYVAQRMLAAKDEKNAMGAVLLFNIAHYALRPWPWILVAFASMIMFPNLESLHAAFPNLDPQFVRDDLGYPAMMTFLPTGLIGIVVASLIAAYMSTIATHLNWGSSYIVNDFYKRFIKPQATDKEMVNVGRFSTLILMILACIVSLFLSSAKDSFDILLQIGAGTGLLFILRWFWWRINAWSEITGMVVSFLIAIIFKINNFGLNDWQQLLAGVAITTVSWIAATYLAPATDQKTLLSFFKTIRPHESGWTPVIERGISEGKMTAAEVRPGRLPLEIACMVAGCFTVYAALFAVGYFIYGKTMPALVCSAVAGLGGYFMFSMWKRIQD